MKISRQDIKLLDLTPREVVILRVLEKDSGVGLQIHELADRLSLPHSSLTYTLGQLYARNLVAYTLRGRRKVWQSRLGDVTFRKRLGALESVVGDMRIVEGIDNLKQLYLSALDLSTHERLLILEGTLAVHTIAQKLGLDFIYEWHTRALERKIICETIIGESSLTDLRTGKINPTIIRSTSRLRLWIGYVVPDSLVRFDVAVLSFRNVIVIVDWATVRAVVINTPEPVRLINNFMDALVSLGRKIDVVKELRGALGRLEEKV